MQGKAAIDVIGNPLGKSGGSFLQQILIGMTGSLQGESCLQCAVLPSCRAGEKERRRDEGA